MYHLLNAYILFMIDNNYILLYIYTIKMLFISVVINYAKNIQPNDLLSVRFRFPA